MNGAVNACLMQDITRATTNMYTAFLLLIGLIGCSPAALFIDGPIVQGLFIAYTALAVAIVGVSIRPVEAKHFSEIMWPAAILAAIPAAWMLFQILPMPVNKLVHPIWLSAQAALDEPVTGSISIDRGATLRAFGRYCFVVGIFLVAVAVAIDRTRAELLLFLLAGLTTVAAVVLIVTGLAGSILLDDIIGSEAMTSITSVAALGVIINTAAAVRTIERYETRRTTLDAAFYGSMRTFVICLIAFAICGLAIIFFSTTQVIYTAASGFAVFAMIMITRRLDLRLWENAVIFVIAVGVMIIIATTKLGRRRYHSSICKILCVA